MNWQNLLARAVRSGAQALIDQLARPETKQRKPKGQPAPTNSRFPNASARPAANHTRVYQRGEGGAKFAYRPHPDGVADPGEVVWTWIPYEEDNSVGKDRPVLIVGAKEKDPNQLLAVQLSSKNHAADQQQEALAGRYWVLIGSGAWDRSGRSSWARVDRLLVVGAADVRREGARLDEERFSQVLGGLQDHWR